MMEKMGLRTVADLVRMAEKAQIGPYWTNGQLDGRPIPPP
jgi:hypothetical protein